MGVVEKEKDFTQRAKDTQKAQRREDAGLKGGPTQKPAELDAVGNGGLHAVEEENAAEENENHG